VGAQQCLRIQALILNMEGVGGAVLMMARLSEASAAWLPATLRRELERAIERWLRR
jgi:hypothetical protein